MYLPKKALLKWTEIILSRSEEQGSSRSEVLILTLSIINWWGFLFEGIDNIFLMFNMENSQISSQIIRLLT